MKYHNFNSPNDYKDYLRAEYKYKRHKIKEYEKYVGKNKNISLQHIIHLKKNAEFIMSLLKDDNMENNDYKEFESADPISKINRGHFDIDMKEVKKVKVKTLNKKQGKNQELNRSYKSGSSAVPNTPKSLKSPKNGPSTPRVIVSPNTPKSTASPVKPLNLAKLTIPREANGSISSPKAVINKRSSTSMVNTVNIRNSVSAKHMASPISLATPRATTGSISSRRLTSPRAPVSAISSPREMMATPRGTTIKIKMGGHLEQKINKKLEKLDKTINNFKGPRIENDTNKAVLHLYNLKFNMDGVNDLEEEEEEEEEEEDEADDEYDFTVYGENENVKDGGEGEKEEENEGEDGKEEENGKGKKDEQEEETNETHETRETIKTEETNEVDVAENTGEASKNDQESGQASQKSETSEAADDDNSSHEPSHSRKSTKEHSHSRKSSRSGKLPPSGHRSKYYKRYFWILYKRSDCDEGFLF
jgi:hypothetical protein